MMRPPPPGHIRLRPYIPVSTRTLSRCLSHTVHHLRPTPWKTHCTILFPTSRRTFHASSVVPARAKSPWEILGVPPNADAETIKKAWRAKAKEYHPDLNRSDKRAQERFVEAKLAYEAMLNPEKRMQWEQQRAEEQAAARPQRGSARRTAGWNEPPPPGSSPEEITRFWSEFEKIFHDMDKMKTSQGYQRVRVEFKRPYRGSEFTWTYEGNEKPKKSKPRKAAKDPLKDFFSSVFESLWSAGRPRAEVRPMRKEQRAREGKTGPRRDRPRHQRRRYYQ